MKQPQKEDIAESIANQIYLVTEEEVSISYLQTFIEGIKETTEPPSLSDLMDILGLINEELTNRMRKEQDQGAVRERLEGLGYL